MKIVSSAKIKSSIREELVNQFQNVSFNFFGDIDEVGEDLYDAEILITYGEDLDDEHIEMAKKLKWIMVISAGLDQMPFKKISEKNILITNAKGIHAKPMAEYTIGMILQVARKTKTLIENEKRGLWDRRIPMTEINGQTIAVVGAGTIGAEIGRLAKAFGMNTIGINRSGSAVDNMDQVTSIQALDGLKEADYVVAVLPSTKDTHKLLNAAFFEKMKSSSVFINIGRGQTVDEGDLIEALEQNKISHAVLDVFEKEPLPKEHPFWGMENVTVTPHLSGISAQYQPRAFDIFMKNLQLYMEEKELINVIDPDKGY